MLVESMLTMLPGARMGAAPGAARERGAAATGRRGRRAGYRRPRGALRTRLADQNSSKYSAISHALESSAFAWASISERFIITR